MSEGRVIVAGPSGPIEVHLRGVGPSVVLLPSLGRGAADFDHLAARLDAAGHQVLCSEPRGIGESALGRPDPTLPDLAADVIAVIAALCSPGPVAVVGHAFGNRVTRMVATMAPEVVDRVVLLACGGKIAPAPFAAAALAAVFDTTLSNADHLAAVQTAFFAPGNDPAVWSDGWYSATAAIQSHATRAVPVDDWWAAGRASVLVIQPADDVIAPPENAQHIADLLGDRATLITIPQAGHALLPEQPDAVADAIIGWLDVHDAGRNRSTSTDAHRPR